MDTIKQEHIYQEGQRSVYRDLFKECLEHIQPAPISNLLLERADIVTVLRRLCHEFGDNDWEEQENLGVVIEKHLEDFLHYGLEKILKKHNISREQWKL